MPSVIVTRGDITQAVTYSIERVWHNNGMVILKLDGIGDIDTASKLKGSEIIVSREDALPLEDGEHYRADLLGLRVITDDGEELGAIVEIFGTGANDVYSVAKDGGKPVLIPAIKQCILDIDIPGGLMTVHLLKGLR